MVDASRQNVLNDLPVRPKEKYVLYWMQQSMRVLFNHALAVAIEQADELKLPLVVCYGLMDDYPEANERHYAFMLEGLRDVEADLKKLRIKYVVCHGQPADAAIHFGKSAAVIICDRGYLRHQKEWRDTVADKAECRVIEVESDVVVPVDVVSEKHEYAARTIRPKIHKYWDKYLVPLKINPPQKSSLDLSVKGDIDVSDPDKALGKLKIDRSVKRSSFFTGGEAAGDRLMKKFMADVIDGYKEGRSEPADGRTSQMSKYLHFGQMSPVDLALRVKETRAGGKDDRESYLEELIIRRELSMNYCNFVPNYDSYDSLPEWSLKTLSNHAGDDRPITYTLEQLETAQTGDPYWNAAQMQMVVTGFMHNYMRMYWGKKILEWTKKPREAYERTIYLNNKYELDGRDANSFANISWVFGLHDRPWGERAIFGQIRYMNAAGLKRKFAIDKYVGQINDICREHAGVEVKGYDTSDS